MGIAFYAVARPVERNMEELCRAAWEEMEPLRFESFAVRAKRSDKRFPTTSLETEVIIGRYLLEKLRAQNRNVRVRLNQPEMTCYVEITKSMALVYARKIPGAGGLPPNTAGRMMCLLSGGYDSAVAAYHMMKRGAHLSFVHFYGTGAQAGESSLHVASGLARKLVPYQFHAKLYRVPFEAIQREIVRYAPEDYRVLLYRRMMLRIAEALARRDRSAGALDGRQSGAGGVANAAKSGGGGRGVAHAGVSSADWRGQDGYSGDGEKIGTYDISSEPFHDCCPVFLPKNPALYATAEDLAEAERSWMWRRWWRREFAARR